MLNKNYSAFFSQSAAFSQSAHLVESQQAVAALSQQAFCSQHSVFCSHASHGDSAFFELLQQEHDDAAAITATNANDIKTFFIINQC